MKVPIKHAIESGAWFHAESKEDKFRLRVFAFEKVKLGDVDNPENLDKVEFNPDDGDFWILKLQIVNLFKTERYITSSILIFDGEGFEFQNKTDNYLSYNSIYAKTSGLANFWGHSFIPKIKYTGAISFFLPKDEDAEYFIGVRGSTIQEV